VVTPTGTTIITSPPPTTTLPPIPGVVRLYTCDPALYEGYVELAGRYYAETGTEVIVMTPDGKSCEDALTELLKQEQFPTIFCIHSQQMLETLQHELQDLSGTLAAGTLYHSAFALESEGKILALAADVEASGIIYNASLLAKSGWSGPEITELATLQTTMNYIKTNAYRTNIYTIAAPDYNDSALMALMAGLHTDPTQLRSFLDVYLANTTVKSTSLTYFLRGTTVFHMGGTWDYDKVAAVGSNKLGFLPALAEDTNAMQCICDHYWAVSSNASEKDLQATLAFLDWLVTTRDSAAPVDSLGLLAPYRDAAFTSNPLQSILRTYIASGNVRVNWKVSGNVTDITAFTAALKTYANEKTDQAWQAVADLMQ